MGQNSGNGDLYIQQALRQGMSALESNNCIPDNRTYGILTNIAHCRTKSMGMRLAMCGSCGRSDQLYNSCRDRHCPVCSKYAREKWLVAQTKRSITSEGYLATFTVPHTISQWYLENGNQRLIGELIMRYSWQVLDEVCREHLGGQIGATSVLHTWTQDLRPHVHAHIMVTMGALRKDGTWSRPRKDYLVPVAQLSHRFKTKMLEGLRDACENGLLVLRENRGEFEYAMTVMKNKKWVVHVEAPISRKVNLIGYLANYVRGTAISNKRISSVGQGMVEFSCSRGGESSDGKKTGPRQVRLSVDEFARRFTWHILPCGFRRVRHFGVSSPNLGKKKCAALDALDLRACSSLSKEDRKVKPEEVWERMNWNPGVCRHCGASGVTIIGGGCFGSRRRKSDRAGPAEQSLKK